ncbi:fimbrial protein [Shewanella baltica]|uniref:fimbrial protein n=1 Tax=Shewanella baltica TaxID=62322 RepID=UPI00325EA91D
MLNLPNVNITDENFQPNGTLLASSVVPFSTYGKQGGYAPEHILFICDAVDVGNIYEAYATNGDSAYGGMYEDGAAYGINSAYATYMKNLAIRVRNNEMGNYFTRYWQYRPMKNLDRDSTGRILIKAKNFTDITVELFRIGDTRGYIISDQLLYNYSQPAAYLAFVGPSVTSPTEGRDSASHYPGWYTNWPGNISLYKQLYIRRSGGCAITNVTPYVLFPKITLAELNNGQTRDVDIQIDYRCQASATIKGPNVGANAIMFKIDSENYHKAKALGLVSGDAVSFLVTNSYDTNMMSKGVGVKLSRNDQMEQPFSYSPNQVSTSEQYSAGWRPLLGNKVGSLDGNTLFSDTYKATLTKLPGISPTAGNFYAKAEVIIRVQ